MTTPVRIPADVDLPDRVLGPLTGRQVAVLAATAAALYGLWQATSQVLPPPVFLAVAAPVVVAATAIVLGRRDGLTWDRLLLSAVRHHTSPRERVAAPDHATPPPVWLAAASAPPRGREGMPPTWEAPAHAVYPVARDLGVIDLGPDGLAAIAVASTVTFALRTPAEQEALVAGFGRYLHSLTAPVQVLIRTQRLDLSGQITDLLTGAAGLPDPGLSRLAHEHAAFLADLEARTELLRPQVLLVWREPTAPSRRPYGGGGRRVRGRVGETARRIAEDRLSRRVDEATDLLGPIGITLTPLDPAQAGAVLVAATNPGLPQPPTAHTAAPGDTVTAAHPHRDPEPEGAHHGRADDAHDGAGDDGAGDDGAGDDGIEDANRQAASQHRPRRRGGWRR